MSKEDDRQRTPKRNTAYIPAKCYGRVHIGWDLRKLLEYFDDVRTGKIRGQNIKS